MNGKRYSGKFDIEAAIKWFGPGLKDRSGRRDFAVILQSVDDWIQDIR